MEVTFNLEPNVNRPIIRLDNIFKGCTALLDTGAVFPVWTKSVVLLRQLGAILYKKNLTFSGFIPICLLLHIQIIVFRIFSI